MPDSVLDGGTYGCMNLIPDFRGLRYSWARQKTETGTEERHQSTRVGAAHGPKYREEKARLRHYFCPPGA